MDIYEHMYNAEPSFNDKIASALNHDDKALLQKALAAMEDEDIADFLVIASGEQRDSFISLLGDDFRPQVLLHVDSHLRENMIDRIGFNRTADLIKDLDEEDIIYLIKDIDREMRDAIMERLPTNLHKYLYRFLSFPEGSAGRLITKNIIAVSAHWSIGNVIDLLRSSDNIPERLYQIYVMDDNRHPIGSVGIDVVVTSKHDVAVGDVMDSDIKVLNANMNQEEAAHIFLKYELISAPVVNEAGIMIGVISFEDVMEVIKREADQDMLNLGGVLENDMYAGIVGTIIKRLPWLSVNVIMAMTTSFVISIFDSTIEKLVTLAVLMPIIASTGGNAGIQSVTVIIRALVKKEIRSTNSWRIVVKEILAGMGSGLIIASCSFVVIWLLFHSYPMAVLFSCSIICVFTFSSFVGSCTPLFLNFIGVDPAIASSIVVTTCTDIISYSVFLGFATLFILR